LIKWAKSIDIYSFFNIFDYKLNNYGTLTQPIVTLTQKNADF